MEQTVMQGTVIQNTLADGTVLEAEFLPELGMNLVSLKRNDVQLIDQSTRPQFEERFAGLGALIGPHFHRRKTSILPSLDVEEKFPHIARVKAQGIEDPFSHGISRYAPWQAMATAHAVEATLKGDMEWNGVALSALQGQNFSLQFKAHIDKSGLHIDYSVASDYDSMIGLHYYYRLPEGAARVLSDVKQKYLDQGIEKNVPAEWTGEQSSALDFDLKQEADFTFHPHLNPCGARVKLCTNEYTLETDYHCTSAENGWQLYHPQDASFVCVEPLTAANPRKPVLSVSRLNVSLKVSDPE